MPVRSHQFPQPDPFFAAYHREWRIDLGYGVGHPTHMTRSRLRWLFVFGLLVATASAVEKTLVEKAQKGDAGAQYKLGVMYASGDGVPLDRAEAEKWLRMSAEQDNIEAQNRLGELYRLEGIINEAAKWFHKAAEQGNADAQCALGYFYSGFFDLDAGRSKEVVARDPVEAVKWWRKAAEQGNAVAQQNLGVCYAKGEGVLKDEVEGLAWLNIAAISRPAKSMWFREELEKKLGQQVSLIAQKRSKEMLKEIKATKP